MKTPAPESQETPQYLCFFIGDCEYGLGILEAFEIIQYPSVTKVPSMPASIRGVINLRGAVVPVLDLSIMFGFPDRPITKWTCIVIVQRRTRQGAERDLVGIVVDSVSQVIELPATGIEPPPSFGTQVKRHFLRGMGKSGDGFVLLLDLERLFGEVDLERVVGDPLVSTGTYESPDPSSAPGAGVAEGDPG